MSRNKTQWQPVNSGGKVNEDEQQGTEEPLREYRVPWNGPMLLACRKCSRKLKGCGADFSRPKKWLKKRRKHDRSAVDVKLVEVSCLKVCPKGGVTMLAQQQMASMPAKMAIVHSDKEMESLYRQMFVAGSLGARTI